MFLTGSMNLISSALTSEVFLRRKAWLIMWICYAVSAPAGKFRQAFLIWRNEMETRVALIGIVVENFDSAQKINDILHNYGQYIIGRMGIPYKERNVSIISVAVDAPTDVISAMSGKLGRLDGVSAKTVYARLSENDNGQD